jgi:ParB family chromosome partitioning protein
MTTTWTATAGSYFGRVTKARSSEAVREPVSEAAAAPIADMKKPQMAEAAERLVAGTGWLPRAAQDDPPVRGRGFRGVPVHGRRPFK